MSRSRKTRAVVLLSGGMDSSVCAALATRDFETAALHISYGQRTQEREQQSFLGICEVLRIRERLIVRNEALRAIGGSALTDPNIDVPQSHTLGQDIPSDLCPLPQCSFFVRRSKLG